MYTLLPYRQASRKAETSGAVVITAFVGVASC